MSAEDADVGFDQPLPQVTTREDEEYAAWARSLGVEPDRVREAVARVGHSADAVREWVARR